MILSNQSNRFRVTGRRTRGQLGSFTENLTRDETIGSHVAARRMAIVWASEGFTVWLTERRDAVPGFTAPGTSGWVTLDEFSPKRPRGRSPSL